MTPTGNALLSESTLVARSGAGGGKMVCIRNSKETRNILTSDALEAVLKVMNRVLFSKPQSGERGIRCLKAPFGRFWIPLAAVSLRGSRLLRLCVHLLNLRTRVVFLTRLRLHTPHLMLTHSHE